MDGLSQLVEISNFYGADEDYVLGGGGNTSYKDSEKGSMYVKASGYCLADITRDGFAAMSLEKLAEIMKKSYPEEDDERERQALEDLMNARMKRSAPALKRCCTLCCRKNSCFICILRR